MIADRTILERELGRHLERFSIQLGVGIDEVVATKANELQTNPASPFLSFNSNLRRSLPPLTTIVATLLLCLAIHSVSSYGSNNVLICDTISRAVFWFIFCNTVSLAKRASCC